MALGDEYDTRKLSNIKVLTANISVMLFFIHDTILNVTSTPPACILIGPKNRITVI